MMYIFSAALLLAVVAGYMTRLSMEATKQADDERDEPTDDTRYCVYGDYESNIT